MRLAVKLSYYDVAIHSNQPLLHRFSLHTDLESAQKKVRRAQSIQRDISFIMFYEMNSRLVCKLFELDMNTCNHITMSKNLKKLNYKYHYKRTMYLVHLPRDIKKSQMNRFFLFICGLRWKFISTIFFYFSELLKERWMNLMCIWKIIRINQPPCRLGLQNTPTALLQRGKTPPPWDYLLAVGGDP